MADQTHCHECGQRLPCRGCMERDAERWRVLCRNFGNEHDLAAPGKQHDIVIKLNPECERYKPDGSLDFAATLAAIMDDESRIQAGASGALDMARAPVVPGVAPATDPLERCKQIRERVAELEAKAKRLTEEHNALLGTGVVDADDLAWATGKAGVEPTRGGER